MNGSRQHLACSFMPACLRCRTLVDTNVILYELCCSVRGRLKAFLLCVRYVGTRLWLSELGLCLRGFAQKKKSRFENKHFVVVCVPWRPYCNQSWWYSKLSPRRAPPLLSCSPRGWYSPVPWLGLRRAPVPRSCHANTNTRARFLLLLLWFCCIIACGCGAATTAV